MSNGASRTNPLSYLVALVAVGIVAWWILKFLFGLLFFLIIGALVVGGIYVLSGKARRAIGRGNRR